MPLTPLDYRNPLTARNERSLRRQLWLRQGLYRFKCAAMIGFGIPLLFVSPALIASIVTHVARRARWSAFPGWWTAFALSSLVLIPLLWWNESRPRGKWFVGEMIAQGAGDDLNGFGMLQTASRGKWEMRTTAATWAAYIELFLFAPRLLISGLEQARGARIHELKERQVERAARVLEQLLSRDEGVDPSALLLPGESPLSLRAILRSLQFFNWIDVAKGGTRVWLLSDARRKLR